MGSETTTGENSPINREESHLKNIQALFQTITGNGPAGIITDYGNESPIITFQMLVPLPIKISITFTSSLIRGGSRSFVFFNLVANCSLCRNEQKNNEAEEVLERLIALQKLQSIIEQEPNQNAEIINNLLINWDWKKIIKVKFNKHKV